MQLQISDVQILATPEYFIGIVHLYILNFDVVHLAEHFGCVDTRIGHFRWSEYHSAERPPTSKNNGRLQTREHARRGNSLRIDN